MVSAIGSSKTRYLTTTSKAPRKKEVLFYLVLNIKELYLQHENNDTTYVSTSPVSSGTAKALLYVIV